MHRQADESEKGSNKSRSLESKPTTKQNTIMKFLRTMKTIFFVVMSFMALPLMAQTNKGPQVVKETPKAKVVVENGKTKLVLKSGQKKDNIEINVDNNTWRLLDSIVTAPYSSPYHVKGVGGYSVGIQRANVSSYNGLIFSSGSRFMAITQEDLNKLKK